MIYTISYDTLLKPDALAYFGLILAWSSLETKQKISTCSNATKSADDIMMSMLGELVPQGSCTVWLRLDGP
jgi:hypothetical protein